MTEGRTRHELVMNAKSVRLTHDRADDTDGERGQGLLLLQAPRHGPVVQPGVHAGLSSRRSRVQIPSGPPLGFREEIVVHEGPPASS